MVQGQVLVLFFCSVHMIIIKVVKQLRGKFEEKGFFGIKPCDDTFLSFTEGYSVRNARGSFYRSRHRSGVRQKNAGKGERRGRRKCRK